MAKTPDPFNPLQPKGIEAKGLTTALRFLKGRRGPATDADAPPPSTFPSTPASREALRMAREADARAGIRRHRVVNRNGVIVRERRTDSPTAAGSATAGVGIAPAAANTANNVVPITAARRR